MVFLDRVCELFDIILLPSIGSEAIPGTCICGTYLMANLPLVHDVDDDRFGHPIRRI